MNDFRVQFRVSWVETDAAQVVHFTNYFRYFERAEEALYNKLGFDFLSLSKYGVWIPRVEAHCKYLSSCRFNDLIEVSIRVEEIKEKAIRYGFMVNNLTTGKKAAEGYVVIVSVSINENRAVPIPKEIVEKIRSFFEGNVV
ncbi:MAG: thioesterase family protein [Thermoprotei archaeon]